MLGAIIGDIVGSRFEFHNYKDKNFDFFHPDCFATDDSYMTLAIAEALMTSQADPKKLGAACVKAMQRIGRLHLDSGFGNRFYNWIVSDSPKPYQSFGNGAAMRVSPVAWWARTEEEALELAEIVTAVSHDHEEGIKGAKATALAIFMARQGATKKEIRDRIQSDYYPLDFTIDEIREGYHFTEICQETVPQAIECFLESEYFEDCLRLTISLGGDSDTLAAISGAIAEAYYGIPDFIQQDALHFLKADEKKTLRLWSQHFADDLVRSDYQLITKYADKLTDPDLWNDFAKEIGYLLYLHPELNLKDYQAALKSAGLSWTEKSLREAKLESLEVRTIIAMILSVNRVGHFTGGVYEQFLSDGTIGRWLQQLSKIAPKSRVFQIEEGLESVKLIIRATADRRRNSVLELDAYQLTLETSFEDGDAMSHHYEFSSSSKTGFYLLKAVEKVLNAPDWLDLEIGAEAQGGYFVYQLEAKYEDRGIALHQGIFDRAHLPEKEVLSLVQKLRELVSGFAFGDVLALSGFDKILKTGEVKYCAVSFHGSGRSYHYRTSDLRIEEGDEVIVPVGEDNHEMLGRVSDVEICRWDDTPYPLEQTKEILRLAADPILSETDLLADSGFFLENNNDEED